MLKDQVVVVVVAALADTGTSVTQRDTIGSRLPEQGPKCS